MEDSGTDAGHTDESDLLDAQMTSGIPLIGAGRARLICTRCLHLRSENARYTPACELERSGKRPLLPDRREGLFQFYSHL